MNSPDNSHTPIQIHSNQLSVEIARPGSVYTGTRFDWSGLIVQVILTPSAGSQHTFCVPESLQPGQGTGGRGLSNEFGNDKPVGYADAQPGESFPKLGIGLLKRPERPQYNFFFPHEIDSLYPFHVSSTESTATFTVDPVDCRGYAASLKKIISVHDNWLEIAYSLENVGSRAIMTNEYCHNFVGIDQHQIGPDYRLHFPYPIQLEDIAAAYRHFLPPLLRKILPVSLQDRLLKRRAAPGNKSVLIQDTDFNFINTPQSAFYFRTLGFSKTEQHQWELTYLPDGIKIREYDDFNPSRVAIWGTTHVISAEIYIDINLQPGQGQSWTRRYEFIA
jgi:hypothetical protein